MRHGEHFSAWPLTVPVLCYRYTLKDSPEPLGKAADPRDFQVDHDDRIIWLASGLSPQRRERAIDLAVSRAWSECSALVPAVG